MVVVVVVVVSRPKKINVTAFAATFVLHSQKY